MLNDIIETKNVTKNSLNSFKNIITKLIFLGIEEKTIIEEIKKINAEFIRKDSDNFE